MATNAEASVQIEEPVLAPAEDTPVEMPSSTSQVLRPAQRGSAAPAALVVGAGVAAALAVAGKVLLGRFKRDKRSVSAKEKVAAQPVGTPMQSKTLKQRALADVDFTPFGSPVTSEAAAAAALARPTPKLNLQAVMERSTVPAVHVQAVHPTPRGQEATSASPRPVAPQDTVDTQDTAKDQQPVTAPAADPAVLAQHVKMVQELQSEVERLKRFTTTHLVNNSEKLKQLETENAALKNVKEKLEGELDTFKAKAVVNDGESLQIFKQLAARIPTGPRSVCSDTDHLIRDTGSVDGSGAADAGRRRQTLFKQLGQYFTGLARSPAASQPATPRGPSRSGSTLGASSTASAAHNAARTAERVAEAQKAMQLLGAFGGGFGMN